MLHTILSLTLDDLVVPLNRLSLDEREIVAMKAIIILDAGLLSHTLWHAFVLCSVASHKTAFRVTFILRESFAGPISATLFNRNVSSFDSCVNVGSLVKNVTNFARVYTSLQVSSINEIISTTPCLPKNFFSIGLIFRIV